ncbi:hypothetical protein MBLNU230_g6453t1 [Neophaeotheca triangularis]
MGDSQNTALAKRSRDESMLMPPPPPTKRIKRPAQVLDEDMYSQAVSDITQRDYFPELPELKLQNELLAALHSGNRERRRQATRDLINAMTPRAGRPSVSGTAFTTPKGSRFGSTPAGYPRSDADFAPEGLSTRPNIDDLSLERFVQLFTSEDNESVYRVFDKQNAEHFQNNAFYHTGNQIPSKQLVASRAAEQKMIGNGDGSSGTLIKHSSSHPNMAPPPRPSQDLSTRPASLDNFPNTQGAKNHFFFGPEGLEDRIVTVAQQAEERSKAPPKAIDRASTRFHPTIDAAPAAPSSPTMSAVDAAIAGRPKPTSSEAGNGGETPRVNGYAFVDSEPTPQELGIGIPVTDEEADAAEEEAAMKFLPPLDDSGPNPFKINNRGKRDETLGRVVEKIDAGKRESGKGGRLAQLQSLGITPGGKTPTPSFASARGMVKGKGLTPAARSLAERIGTPRKGSNMAVFGDKKKQGGWTPTPRRK